MNNYFSEDHRSYSEDRAFAAYQREMSDNFIDTSELASAGAREDNARERGEIFDEEDYR